MMGNEASNNSNNQDDFDPFVGPSLEQVAAWPKKKLLSTKHDVCGGGCTLLHHALGWGQSPDLCKALMEKVPEMLSMKNDRGSVPIINLKSTMNFSVQEMLVEKTPKEAINNINKEGWTNLGYAIREGAHPSVIHALMNKCDDSLFLHKERDGRLLLHSAAQKNAPLDIVRELIRRSGTGALAVEDDQGHLPIHSALSTGRQASLAVVRLLLNQTPSEALERPSKKDGSYLLHRISLFLPRFVLELVLERFPAQMSKTNRDGQLPIHTAVQKGAPCAFLSILVERFPECLIMTNCHHQIALHLARNVETLEFLLEHLPGPDALFWQDGEGLMPIHQFIKTQKPKAMIKVLLDRCSQQKRVDWTGSFGRTALEFVLFDNFAEPWYLMTERRIRTSRARNIPARWKKSIAGLFLESSPYDLLATYDPSGETLLHAAIQRIEPKATTAEEGEEDLILWLIKQAGQDALDKANARGMLPLHCLVEQGYPFLHVMTAVKEYPDSVHQKDSKGRLPLFVACPNPAGDLSTIFLFLRMAPDLCQGNASWETQGGSQQQTSSIHSHIN